MGTGAGPLAPLEIAVGGADRAQIGKAVVADMTAVSACGLMPFKARVDEDAVKPLGLGGALDGRRARHTNGLDVGTDLAALEDLRRSPQV